MKEGNNLGFESERFLPLFIGDSKRVFSQRDKGRGERSVRALSAMIHGSPPESSEEFLNRFTFQGEGGQSCPEKEKEMCWHGIQSLPFWDRGRSTENVREEARNLKRVFSGQGLELVDVRSEVCCVRDFNAFLKEGQRNKTAVNFLLFEKVIQYFFEKQRGEMAFLCGKNMAVNRYEPYFGFLARFPLVSKKESKKMSSYRLKGLGEVSFLMDGEGASLPIAISSLFGKYIREMFMERQNMFFRKHISGHTHISGYRDGRTAKFLSRLGNPEHSLGIQSECFLRIK